MGVASLGYIGFEVSDLKAWDDYLTGFLGLMPGHGNGASARYRMDDRAFRIHLDKGAADDISFIGLEVETPEGLQALRERLEKAGVPCCLLSTTDAADDTPSVTHRTRRTNNKKNIQNTDTDKQNDNKIV